MRGADLVSTGFQPIAPLIPPRKGRRAIRCQRLLFFRRCEICASRSAFAGMTGFLGKEQDFYMRLPCPPADPVFQKSPPRTAGMAPSGRAAHPQFFPPSGTGKKGRKRKIRGEWAALPPRSRLILSPILSLFVTFARKAPVLPKLGATEIRLPDFSLRIHPENSDFLRLFSKTTCRSMYASSSDPADPVRRTIRTQNFLNCSSPKSVHRCKSPESLPHRDDNRRPIAYAAEFPSRILV